MKDKESKIQKHINHIEKYENSPLVQEALLGTNKFTNECRDFYDVKNVETHFTRLGPYKNYYFEKQGKENFNETPLELINIVNPFSYLERDLDKDQLKYNSVRGGYKSFKKSWPGRLAGTLLHLGCMVGTGAGAIYSLKNPSIGIPLTIGAGFLGYRTLIKPPLFPRDNGFDEFKTLYNACENADSFIEHHYKDYFVNKTIEQNKEKK